MQTVQRSLPPVLRRLRRELAERSFAALKQEVPIEQCVMCFAAGAGLDATELLRQWAGVSEKTPKKRTPKVTDDEPTDDDAPLPVDVGEDDDDEDDEDEKEKDDVEDDEE